MLVRPATSDDIAACVSLALSHSGGEAEEWRVRLARELSDPDCLVVVAVVAGEVVGYGRAAWFEPPPGAAANVAPSGYYLVGLVVAPEARRRGVGRALTEARLAWIESRATEAWYFANARNEASLELHRQLGFVEVTRSFSYPEVTFEGGTGVLCKARLPYVELIDISVPLRTGMVVWEGDPPFRIVQVASMADGEDYNVTRLDASTHTGTHIDAPRHAVDGGGTVDGIPLGTLVGPCHVVDATAVAGQLDADAVAALELPADTGRLLFKTRNGVLWERDEFSPDFSAFTGDGAEALVALGVRLAGIDYLSIGDHDAHRVLLGAAVVPLEGLDLRAVEPGPYTLFCLPLKLAGTDGAPVRALLVRE